MKERDFLNRVIAMAETFGWSVWHVPAPMRATKTGTWVGAKEAAGLPDLIMLHDDPPRLVFAELKGTGGKLSDKQREFLRAAQLVSGISRESREPWTQPHFLLLAAYVWLPEDEPTVEMILRSRTLV